MQYLFWYVFMVYVIQGYSIYNCLEKAGGVEKTN